jgi:hypothetical protein
MCPGFLSETNRCTLAARACRQRKKPGIARQATARVLPDDGTSCHEIADFPYLDDDTIRDGHKTYQGDDRNAAVGRT